MKKWVIALMCLFFIPIITMGILSIYIEDREISDEENRTLASMPVLNAENWFDESFALGFEEYFSDQFPFRDKFISGNTTLNYFYLFNLPSSASEPVLISQDDDMLTGGGVFLGEDEYYDPTAAEATPEPSENIQETAQPDTSVENTSTTETTPEPTSTPDYPDLDDAELAYSSLLIVDDMAMELTTNFDINIDYYASVVNKIAGYAGDDVNCYNMLIPTSGQYYSPEKFHSNEYDQEYMIDRAYSGLDNVTSVDAYTKLYENMNEYIYFRTDHHWTALGAYYGYVAFCESADITPVALDEFEKGQYERFLGSLFLKIKDNPVSNPMMNNPDYLDYYMPIVDTDAYYYISHYMETKVPITIINSELAYNYSNKYLCFLSGDCPLLEINTDVNNGKTILVIRESYGNAFIPFLTSHYETIYAYDPRKFNSASNPKDFRLDYFINEQDIDDILVMNNIMMVNSRGFAQLIDAAYPPQ